MQIIDAFITIKDILYLGDCIMNVNSGATKYYYIKGGGGTKLYVEEFGKADGIPLLFIHGFSQCRLVWKKQYQSDLSEHFRIITMDVRGHGFSDKPINGYDQSQLWADDINEVIQQLMLDRPILVGWSYAGIQIFDYLRHYGEASIRGVNLVSARSRAGIPEAKAETGNDYLSLRENMFSNDVKESVQALQSFIKLCTFKDLSAEELYFYLGFNMIVPPIIRKKIMDRAVSNDDLLLKLSIPFLLTHGLEDQIVLPATSHYNSERLQNQQTSFYEQIGHNPFWEAPERFNKELKEFALALQ